LLQLCGGAGAVSGCVPARGDSRPGQLASLVLIEPSTHVRGGCTPGNSRHGAAAYAALDREDSARPRRSFCWDPSALAERKKAASPVWPRTGRNWPTRENRGRRNSVNGIIILDKPQGFTSFDGVAVLRGLAHEKKIGHTGTLDPMATGVLPILLGRAAKALNFLPDTDKEYVASFRLGERRDTGDITGQVVEESPALVSQQALEAALPAFRGEILQVPPMYSAVSVGGKRLYGL